MAPEVNCDRTVISITLDSPETGQVPSHVTFDNRLYQVVCVSASGLYPVSEAPSMSTNPEDEPVVDFCHLYSSVPLCPDGNALLVIGFGAVL